MIYKVKDKTKFKEDNLKNWHGNSEFWLQSKMRHLRDVYHFTGKLLQETIKDFDNRELTLIDFGCGEGWLLRLIKEYKFDLNYFGVDFNIKFISALKEKYKEEKKIDFFLYDMEENLPPELIKQADIATNFFNFFEIPNIEEAFKNVCSSINENGVLIVLTIDPVMQLLAVSESYEAFLESLREYENNQCILGYDKDIDIGDFKSGRIYKSILYSSANYIELAKKNGMNLFDYKEVVKTGNFVPQIYQYILFKKLPQKC